VSEKERKSGLNQKQAQRLMAWHIRGQRPRTEEGEGSVLDLRRGERRQALRDDFGIQAHVCAVFVVIGRQQSIPGRTNGMMGWMVSTAATQASEDVMAFASHAVIGVRAVERSLRAARQGEEQAQQNDIHQRLRNRSHR
jgi:hypothetical protein